MRGVVARQLLELGYRVIEASDGANALSLAAEEPVVHLLLTDVVMPGLTGSQVAERFLEAHPQARVQFMSGDAALTAVVTADIL